MKLINNTRDLLNSLRVKSTLNLPIRNFEIDSRKVKKNSVFFGLSGTRENGSIYAKEAIQKGASLAIVKEQYSDSESKSSKIISVKSPEKTLISLAKLSMQRYKGFVIGITGSNGKTTTKNILHCGIPNSFASYKNYNNEIGLPLCALSLDKKHKKAIFEMGASKFGDIDLLSKIIKPNIGIITHIGFSHLKGLNSLNGVLKVKSELIENIKNGGTAIVPDCKYLNYWKNIRNDINFFTFGFNSSASFFPSRIKTTRGGISFFIESEYLEKSYKINTSLIGNHNIMNILASFSALYQTKSDIDFFIESLRDFQNSHGRLEINSWVKGTKLIDDSYNANPDSVKASIEVLSNFKTSGKRVLVLGDMKELGRFRKKLHKQIGEYAKLNGIDILIGFGNLTSHSVSSFGNNGFFFENKGDLYKFLISKLVRGDVVLLKGSRSMEMEELIGWPF
ncbi:MAG: UDP-N-acetylmuramoyl-tripeptide--D-alanyl-D-alanine ligase [Gammaproteobacteria bacterium]|nr:UDP-N-acetylmuramoyl-tripeptide--D-alanyl-D-alanine ligase [Gammaproteobacteria bacterium]